MKIHLITIGKPKLAYAGLGWQEYLRRLQHGNSLRVTHLSDKFTDDSQKFIETSQGSYRVGLVIGGREYDSPGLAKKWQDWQQLGREVSFIIGGPDGLPKDFIAQLDEAWSLSQLTLPHDLAMVVTLEALYRAQAINIGHPYHH